MKFGGASIIKPQRLHQVAKLITSEEGRKIVVLCASSGITNALAEISEALSLGDKNLANLHIESLKEDFYPQYVAELLTDEQKIEKANEIFSEHFKFLNSILNVSFSESLSKDIIAEGELLNTKLFSVYLQQQHIEHVVLSALDFMFLDRYEEAQVGTIKVRLAQLLNRNKDIDILITQGNIARNAKGEVDNLRNGGADFSASLIAAAVNADVCEIWTDIDGMRNNDPRIVKETLPIEHLSFDEAADLAYFGAKILHPASIWPTQFFNIPLRLLNILKPDAQGTLITENARSNGVKAVAAKDGITAITIKTSRMLSVYTFLMRTIENLEKYNISFDMITISKEIIFVSIDYDIDFTEIVKDFEEYAYIKIETNQTIVSIVGNEIIETKDIMRKTFESLSSIPLRRISYGGSRNNISILIDRSYKEQTLKLLNKVLFNL